MAKRRGNHEGSIYKRPNGRYQAQITLKGHRLAKTFNTHKECRDWIREITEQKEKGLTVSSTKIDIENYLLRWLEDIKPSLKLKTWYQYKGIIYNHILPSLGKVKLMDLRTDTIQKFYTTKSQQDTSKWTIERIHTVFRRSLGMAQKQGLIPYNPVQGVERPKIAQREMQVLDESQVQQLLIAARGTRIEALIHLAVTTGMRQGELMGLKWKDLDWVSQELHVKRQLQRIPHQGQMFSSPKTRAGKRLIKLGSETIRLLGIHLKSQEQERDFTGSRWEENNLIFPSPFGKPIEQKRVHKDYKKLLKAAGLPDIRFHDLRHTAATLMLLNGVPILVVSKRLGHAKVSTTLDIYGHFLPGMQDEAAAIMDELVTPVAADLQQVKETAVKEDS